LRSRGTGRLPGLNPVAKILMLAIVSILVILITSPVLMTGMIVAVLVWKRHLRARGIFTKGVLGFAFAIFIAQVLFNHTGEEAYSIAFLSATTGGISTGITIAGKFLCLIMMSWMLIATTKPSDLSSSLMSVRMPYRYAYLPALAMRFVPIFQFELNSVREAQTVRGLRLDKSVKGLIRSAKYTVLPMFFSAMFKVNSLAASMTGRGFGGHADRTLLRPRRPTPSDGFAVLATAVLAAVIFQLDRYLSANLPLIS
jgi:energy-coupling factor transport system permease protein